MNMIAFQNVDFSYDQGVEILKDISFQVAPHEFIGIVGPNGGGKTTLLKLIMGLLTPTKGSVWLKGTHPAKARTCIGYVPQIAAFDRDFPLTTLELVLMGCTADLTPWGSYTSEAKQRAMQALEKVGLLAQKNHSFGKLSGGQARRALIARAIVSSPSLLLLDEPTANIDREAENSISHLLVELKKEMTILMVTHELPGIIPFVDRVLCVQHSLSILPPAEVCKHTAMGIYHTPKGRGSV